MDQAPRSPLRIKGDINRLKAARPAAPPKHPALLSATRECASETHRGPRQVGIEKFWDRHAGVLRSTCAACRHNRKVAKRRRYQGVARQEALDAEAFWQNQASSHM